MKNKLIYLVIAVKITAACFASDAVTLFVADLLEKRATEVWFVPNRLKDTVPKGGYLLKFELDLNGDGQNEVFLATSLDVDRKGEMWAVYKKTGADYSKLSDELFLGSDLRMKIENGIRKFSCYIPQKHADGGSYFECFWLDHDGIFHDETHTLTDDEQATMDGEDSDTNGNDGKPDVGKIANKLRRGVSVTISIKKILLAKYSQNTSSAWSNVNTEVSLAQQYKDPVDAADIASIKNWQPPVNP